MWTAEGLLAFEEEIRTIFNRGKIKAPVHFAGGNEQQLIDIFQHIRPQDWVCGGWRMHYHCLLKGVPADELKAAIVEGRSIALNFPQYRILSSAIVGGIMPIALGLALAVKRKGLDERVWCFVGDMTLESGIAHEVRRYAQGFDLPFTLVSEDNGLSVVTPTLETWGADWGPKYDWQDYCYHMTVPHVGTGQWVKF